MENNKDYLILIDLINVFSFILGLKNLEENNEQSNSLEEYLNKQDAQYEKIISLLEDLKNS